MRKIMRDHLNLASAIKDLLRYIPFIDRLYQRSYPAHHEYNKHVYAEDYGRVGLPSSCEPKPRTASFMMKEAKNAGMFSLEYLVIAPFITLFARIQDLPGLLQPLVNMLKDAVDTLRPYKSDFYRQRDWYQPWNGVKNCLMAILDLLFGAIFCAKILFTEIPFFMLICIIGFFSTPFSDKPGRRALRSIGGFIAAPFIFPVVAIQTLAEPILRFTRGITQIVTFPLTYLFKKSIRHMLTPKNYIGMPTAEANNTIKMLVGKLQALSAKPAEDQTSDTTQLIADDASKSTTHLIKASMLHTVHFKYAKGQWKGKTFDAAIQQQEAEFYQKFVDAKDQRIAFIDTRTHHRRQQPGNPYCAQNVKDAQGAYETFVLNDLATAPQLIS